MSHAQMFADLSTPLVADACIRCDVPLRAAPTGITAVVAGQRLAGRALPVRHYGSYPPGPVRLDEQEPDALTRARFGPHTVTREDIVFADADGVVFVAAARADEVLATAREIWEKEREQAVKIRAGETLRVQTAFDEYLAQRAADPSTTFRRHLRRIGGAIEE